MNQSLIEETLQKIEASIIPAIVFTGDAAAHLREHVATIRAALVPPDEGEPSVADVVEAPVTKKSGRPGKAER